MWMLLIVWSVPASSLAGQFVSPILYETERACLSIAEEMETKIESQSNMVVRRLCLNVGGKL